MASDQTNIEWTDASWNPVTGCSKVSPGCAHCYAEGVAARFWPKQYRPMLNDGSGKTIDTISTSHHEDYLASGLARPRQFTDVMCHEDRLDQPLRWKKPRRIFVNSMSDLFHEDVPDAFIDQVFAVMSLASRHTFQILTKRPERMRKYFEPRNHHGSLRQAAVNGAIWSLLGTRRGSKIRHGGNWRCAWPLPNVWIGVSVENPTFKERLDDLVATPAAVRFVSLEPLLADIGDLTPWLRSAKTYHVSADVQGMLRNRSFAGLTGDNGEPLSPREAEEQLWALHAKGVKVIRGSKECVGFSDQSGCPGHQHARLDWVIVGGESGPKSRPFDISWARSIVQQCQAAGVPVFVKQLGARVQIAESPLSEWAGKIKLLSGPDGGMGRVIGLRDKKGGDPSEWPADVQVREFPGEAVRS